MADTPLTQRRATTKGRPGTSRSRAGKGWKPTIRANAMPRPGDVRSAAISLSRGRLPEGSLAQKIVSALTQGGAQIPRSARPIGPVARANAQAASMVAGSDTSRTVANATRRSSKVMNPIAAARNKGQRGAQMRSASAKGPFKPGVKLDRSQVRDMRGATNIEKMPAIRAVAGSKGPGAARRREGASSSTSGPRRPAPGMTRLGQSRKRVSIR